MIRDIIWHKELFVFIFWRLSQDDVSKLDWPIFSSFKFQSISIPFILGCKQQRIASVHFNGHWQQTYIVILWSSLMQRRLLVFWILTKIAWPCYSLHQKKLVHRNVLTEETRLLKYLLHLLVRKCLLCHLKSKLARTQKYGSSHWPIIDRCIWVI